MPPKRKASTKASRILKGEAPTSKKSTTCTTKASQNVEDQAPVKVPVSKKPITRATKASSKAAQDVEDETPPEVPTSNKPTNRTTAAIAGSANTSKKAGVNKTEGEVSSLYDN